ncbi:Uncharacterised protein [Vibrio cholerae]|nr:Uncharacterised protein [Vibrio cholerae]
MVHRALSLRKGSRVCCKALPSVLRLSQRLKSPWKPTPARLKRSVLLAIAPLGLHVFRLVCRVLSQKN